MHVVNIHEAKTHLSRLLAEVAAGDEVVIAKAGRPIARLLAYEEPVAKRRFGRDRGLFEVPDDFDEPLPDDLLASFESSSP
ncbi:type II toxin-antitoxin system Phd/YefM family antitoxin [Endothiovibrio diazotrophicus]